MGSMLYLIWPSPKSLARQRLIGVGGAVATIAAVGAAVAFSLAPPARPAAPASQPWADLPTIGEAGEYVDGRSQAAAPHVDSQAAAQSAVVGRQTHHGVPAATVYDWSAAEVRAAVRLHLWTLGPVAADAVAWPPPDHPDADSYPIPPAIVPWTPGGWLVESAAGRWWVVEAYGSVSPADDVARGYQARLSESD